MFALHLRQHMQAPLKADKTLGVTEPFTMLVRIFSGSRQPSSLSCITDVY